MFKKVFLFVTIIAIIIAGCYFYYKYKKVSTFSIDYESTQKVVQDKLSEVKITASVMAALSMNKNFKFFDIKVRTQDGTVTLSGVLPDKKLKHLALDIAGNVRGVEKVVDNITINPTVMKKHVNDERTFGQGIDDVAITANVKTALALNKYLEGSKIKVTTFKSVVFLEGTVLNEKQKRLAISTALDVDNVRDVKADIIIK
jgi:osmotically-inducible protein OsmY